LLFRDVSLSIILIITIPIVYFIVFIVCFRLKDKGVYKNWNKRFKRVKTPNDVSGKKPLLKSSFLDPHGSSTKIAPSVSVTCTTPDENQVNLI